MADQLDTNDTPNTAAAEENLDDVFSSAFDDAVALAEGGTPAAKAESTEPATAPTEPQSVVEEQPTPTPAAAATDNPAQPAVSSDKPTDPAPAAAPAATAPAATAPETEPSGVDPKFIARAMAELQAEQQRQEQARQQQEQPAVKDLTYEDFLSTDDKAALDKLKTDWPDEYAAFGRLADARASALLTNHHNRFVQELNKFLAPLFQSIGKVEVNSHRSAILAVHSDFDAVLPQVQAWVAAKSGVAKTVYQGVLDKGTAEEINDLVAVYKKEANVQPGAAPATPASAGAPQPTPTPTPAPKPAAVDPAAAAALAAVPAAKRTPPINKDPNDFDTAFEEASKAVGMD